MTPAIYARIGRSITVYSRSAGINPAHRVARRAAGAAQRDARGRRRVHRAARGRAGGEAAGAAVRPASGLTADAMQTWRIRAEASLARWCNLRPRSGRCALRRIRAAVSSCWPGRKGASAPVAAAPAPPPGPRTPMPPDRSFSMGQAAALAHRLRPRAAGLAALLALVVGRARAAGALARAQRGARRRLRPVLAFDGRRARRCAGPRCATAHSACEARARSRSTGDATAVAAAGRAALCALARVAYGGVTGAPRVRVALPSRRCCASTLDACRPRSRRTCARRSATTSTG